MLRGSPRNGRAVLQKRKKDATSPLRGAEVESMALISLRVARGVDRRYVRVRLEDRAELLLVEGNGCNDGLERHHQIRMTLSNVLPRRIVFEELDEISFRKH
ncbi:hypothetical protein [Paraburkholderia bryophila]|uniref:hypothetical protein n=1 Tax=Paraburkholderia bryophila TaxID=420952 RepID=UPI00142E1F6D|nr:hypothetical protein [Paraburkholderia bryophila]